MYYNFWPNHPFCGEAMVRGTEFDGNKICLFEIESVQSRLKRTFVEFTQIEIFMKEHVQETSGACGTLVGNWLTFDLHKSIR